MPYVPSCCSNISIISFISIVRIFEWNVLSTIQVSKIFEWDVGEGPLYWFQVESFPISNCPSITGGVTEVRTVAATSVEHLCDRLQSMGYNRRIKSVKKWTRPALLCDISNISMCNDLVTVDFCVSECANFTDCAVEELDFISHIYVEGLNDPVEFNIK